VVSLETTFLVDLLRKDVTAIARVQSIEASANRNA
jgi:hypothetical protein